MLTGLSVINEIEDRLGWPQSKTLEGQVGEATRTRKAKKLLNRVLKNLTAAETWPMLRAEGTIITEAPLDNTAVRLDLTNGSSTVTISSFDVSGTGDVQLTPFLIKHKIWAIQIGTGYPIYRIEEVLSPTSVKLNRPWIGDDSTPTGDDDDDTFRLLFAMDRYALPEDYDRPSGKWEDFLSIYNVHPAGEEEFAKRRRAGGRTITYDDPQWYTVYGLDPTETYQVLHLHPWPKQQTMLQYNYQRVHPDIRVDDDLILFPQAQLSIVIEAVLYLANRDYEDDTRLQAALQEYLAQFKSVKGENRITSDKKSFTPHVIRARSVRQRRDGGVRIDYGDAFDRVDMTKLP